MLGYAPRKMGLKHQTRGDMGVSQNITDVGG